MGLPRKARLNTHAARKHFQSADGHSLLSSDEGSLASQATFAGRRGETDEMIHCTKWPGNAAQILASRSTTEPWLRAPRRTRAAVDFLPTTTGDSQLIGVAPATESDKSGAVLPTLDGAADDLADSAVRQE